MRPRVAGITSAKCNSDCTSDAADKQGFNLTAMLQTDVTIGKVSLCKCSSMQTCWCHDWLQCTAYRVEWLAGILDAMLRIPKRDCMCARGLAHLVGPMGKVLQDYKARAVASGQTFERVIRLEAAVLGW